MNTQLRKYIALIADIASLGSGAFWHLSADAQVKALHLSGEATSALATLFGCPSQSQEAQQQAIRAAQHAADMLGQISVSQNLHAAGCAVVAGIGALLVAYFD